MSRGRGWGYGPELFPISWLCLSPIDGQCLCSTTYFHPHVERRSSVRPSERHAALLLCSWWFSMALLCRCWEAFLYGSSVACCFFDRGSCPGGQFLNGSFRGMFVSFKHIIASASHGAAIPEPGMKINQVEVQNLPFPHAIVPIRVGVTPCFVSALLPRANDKENDQSLLLVQMIKPEERERSVFCSLGLPG